MKHPPQPRQLLAICLLVLAMLACDLPSLPSLPSPLGGPSPTPVPEIPPNELAFTAPYTSYLHKGERLPGSGPQSGVEYVDATDNGWQVLIDGQAAVKKIGDSLNWKGEAAPGVTLDYKLRVLGVFFEQFEATGSVEIRIRDAAPAAGQPPESADVHFDKLVMLNAGTKAGHTIAGTSITFVGKTDKGAQLGGVEGYAYREVGDSIDWQGQVKPNVWLKLSLRVTGISADELQVAGTGELWIVTGR